MTGIFARFCRTIVTSATARMRRPGKPNCVSILGKVRFEFGMGETVLIPGKSSESELVKRITNTDPDEIMPPTDSNHKLTPKQIELIKQWIDEGATWSDHWAFRTIRKPVAPELKGPWAINEIDRFIQARLEQEGLTPSPLADRERLIRRVTFDLTGLPPTPEEIDRFAADQSPTAYEKLVDRLLASTRYGERMATEWLDLARYADTYGYQMDAQRPVWPYRDWVIKAFNENLPFDQFVTWQLAGDLLPGATKEQRLATAFNRLHLQNEEGGVVDEEFRVAYVTDRVDTFGTAFLGLTLQCAHCHDHKYDPISMRDFYSLFAMFQNIDESGQNPYSNFVNDPPAPTLLLSEPATDAKLAEFERRIRSREQQRAALRQSAQAAFGEWLKNRAGTIDVPGLVAAFSFEEIKDGKTANSVEAGKPGKVHEASKLVSGKSGQGAELDGENGFTFPGVGQFTRADDFSLAIWLFAPVFAERQVVFHRSKAPADAGSRGYELLLEDGHPAVGIHRQWPGNSIKVRGKDRVPTNEWVHVAFTYDGSSRASGLQVFVNGQPVEVEVLRDGLKKDITYTTGEPDLAIGQRFRDSGFKDGRVDELRVYNRALTTLEMAEVAGRSELQEAWKCEASKLTSTQREQLLDYYLANVYPPARQFEQELGNLRRERDRLLNPIPEIMVMEEMAKAKPAHILKRGAYDQPGEAVSADTPSALPAFPKDAPRNRLGLSRWLLSAEHPLLARVTVNRAWQMMFGRGIVETLDNFGSRGAVPSHPELLDWLAAQFMASGWNYQQLLKQIAMSATYRQSSKQRPELETKDPGNLLLARGPAQRLSAEMLRDQALAVSSLLVEKVGGPSVKPYQPAGLWEIAMGNPKYEQSQGDDLHRRSLYTFWKRTVPPPSVTVFDAPERNVCIVQRQATSTPLQALCLLNDVQVTEAARFVSQRMLQQNGSLDEKIAWAFRLVTSRRATPQELAVLKKLFFEQQALFASDPQAAAKLLAVGEASNSPELSPEELAAGTVLAEGLLNHDEAIMRR